jgi:hypothetical protein
MRVDDKMIKCKECGNEVNEIRLGYARNAAALFATTILNAGYCI